MTGKKNLFSYHLPERLIAQRPPQRRDLSRLMVLNRERGTVDHSSFQHFPDLLREGDVLVINKTKVFPARLYAKRKTGGKVELLLVRKTKPCVWEVMARGMQRVSPGESIVVGNSEIELIEKKENGLALVRFENDDAAKRLAERLGEIPLPPYIHRPNGKTDERDKERYQTVFADVEGSCAAPTAGLHFTETILENIRSKGVTVVPIVLHVGPGTFRPVKTENIEDHVMDAERFEISGDTASAVNEAKVDGRRIVAVGSTVTRALESSVNENGEVSAGAGSTDLFITPGRKFKVIDALLTNFHLPESTLLMLVSAFAGREFILKAYAYAVANEYRFFSYGDAMFIE